MTKHQRPKIPDSVRLKLWIDSGGRCEFPGCNKIVWRDGLTLREDNFAILAHMIAASPIGPRGDAVLSPKLARDFSNLMLVCLEHSKLIDGKYKKDFPVEYLKLYKRKHEERIRMQTMVGPNMATTVVRFVTHIGDRPVEISLAQAYEAILPRFPADDKGVFLNFTMKEGRGNKQFWKGFADDISKRLLRDFTPGNDSTHFSHLSIFALAPIPLLMHFGNKLGDLIPADLYQKHRDTDDWKWKREPRHDNFSYEVKKKITGRRSKKIAIILSLSGKIHAKEVLKAVPDASAFYEITIPNPETEFLKFASRLQKFRSIYRDLLTTIRKKHGHDCEIHLFPAVPAPIAVICGKILLPKTDPGVLVYDNDKQKSGFVPALKIN
ncbi:MAG: SAVED domain-containing protein [bacterium]|nr:SAVED domain-containing protein [bacterium]